MSSVTAPVLAKAAPTGDRGTCIQGDAGVGEDIAVNDEVVPSVAELPTLQNTLPPCAPFDQRNHRRTAGGEGAANVEDEDRVGIAQTVEGKRAPSTEPQVLKL
ncbi:MAG: hypothetical protein WDN50_16095 [Bradyrhizobium sp.]